MKGKEKSNTNVKVPKKKVIKIKVTTDVAGTKIRECAIKADNGLRGMAQFIEYKEKDISCVKCILTIYKFSDIYIDKRFVGLSKCNPIDIYNEQAGFNIAFNRSLRKFYITLTNGAIDEFNHNIGLINTSFKQASMNITNKVHNDFEGKLYPGDLDLDSEKMLNWYELST